MNQAASSPTRAFCLGCLGCSGKIALALLVSLLPGRTALAETSVWEVMLGDSLLYLGGTIHVLRPSDYPLPDEFDHAYANADEIYFEADMNSVLMPDQATQEMIAALITYTDGRSLQTVLSEEVYADFYSAIESLGIPPGALDSIKPGMAVTVAVLQQLSTFGFQPQGVEEYFVSLANRDGLPQRWLETLEFQTEMLARMGEGNEDAMFADFVAGMEALEELTNETVKAWREGDMAQLEELLLTEMAEEFPEDFERMIASRNRNWIPPIMAMLEDADTEFVLVGAGHMPGEYGVLALLREQGATIRKLTLPSQ